MPKALTEVLTNEVSLVGRGAVNRKFALKKEASEMDEILKAVMEQEAEGEADIKARFAKSGVSEKGQAALAGMHRLWAAFREEMPDALAKAFPWQEEEDDDDKDKGKKKKADKKKEDAKKSDAEPFDIAKADLPDHVKAHIVALQKSNDESRAEREALAKAVAVERDARLTKEYIEKADRDFSSIGPAAEVGPILKSLHGADEVLAGQVERLLKMAAERANKAALFSERGRSAALAPSGAWDRIVKAADGLVQKGTDGSLTQAAAIDLVIKRDPELYNAYLAERKGA